MFFRLCKASSGYNLEYKSSRVVNNCCSCSSSLPSFTHVTVDLPPFPSLLCFVLLEAIIPVYTVYSSQIKEI